MFKNCKPINKKIKKGLYLVSTPIGNLGDITLRAIEILKMSDYILCEDTRVSKNLFNKYEIKSKLISNHKFNEKKNLSKIIELLKNGLIISLISDAGTPGISDPGSILINKCVEEGIETFPIPGASSVTSAVSISGFKEKFFFYGFIPDKQKKIEEDFRILSELNSSVVFFISSKKFTRIINSIKEHFIGRKILICREMTKHFEEYLRVDIEKIHSVKFELKGELTIVISEKKLDKKSSQILDESDKRMIKKMINKLSIKDIVNLIQQKNKIPRKDIYNYCIKLKNEK